MFRFSLILFLLLTHFSWAQEPPKENPTEPAASSEAVAEPEPEENLGISKKKTTALAYVSWVEFVDLEFQAIEDSTQAQFYGMQLSLENEKFDNHWGTIGEFSLLFGQANAGGNQDFITYQTAYRPWYGASGAYKLAYRPTKQVVLAVGPFALFRQIEWPSEGTNISVKSGAPLNIGAMADLRLHLNDKWEVRQMIGTLAFKASTIWSLGLGFRY
ncbi:MAG: hypothetical protein ACAH59_06955 [Pseudobdellovibrionaceae bacterium]